MSSNTSVVIPGPQQVAAAMRRRKANLKTAAEALQLTTCREQRSVVYVSDASGSRHVGS